MGIIDTQSVDEHRYDSGKKVSGRKHCTFADTPEFAAPGRVRFKYLFDTLISILKVLCVSRISVFFEQEVKMFKIKANPSKNYLYMFLDGFLNDDEILQAADTARAEARKLSPGFTIINNIGSYKPATQKAFDIIAQTQRYLWDIGAVRVIRIVGQNILGKYQWRRTQSQSQAAFEVIEVESLTDAQKIVETES